MTIEGRFFIDRGSFILDVALSIPGQGVTALFGRSGSGKTTILRCLAGLERLPGSRLTVNGDVWQDGNVFLPIHKRALGYVFQEVSLFPHVTVNRNLRYGYRRTPAGERGVDFDETVQLLGLEELLGRYPDELSGGQRQRVSIGRALLTSPRLLLMDEPMASLDLASKKEILPYLERLYATLAIPVIYVSHAIDEVARLADHMVLLEDGRALAQGPLYELLTRSDLPLAHSENASAVIEATVLGHDETYHMSELACEGGEKLLISRENVPPGQRVRVRVLARDVAIALSPPQDSSVCNCLAVSVIEISDDPHPGHVLLRLGLGEATLLSRITRRSCEQLRLVVGSAVYALIKGVTLE